MLAVRIHFIYLFCCRQMDVTLFLLFLTFLSSFCLGDIVTIVQRRGAETSLSCELPDLAEAGGWSLCTFSHEDGAECGLTPGEDGHQCAGLPGAMVNVTEDNRYCRMIIYSLDDNSDGDWTCGVYYDEAELNRKYFHINLISEPSWIDFTPRVEDFYDFDLNDSFEATLYVFMVNPQPVIQWTINGESIQGVHFIQTEIIPEEPIDNMEVVQELLIPEMLGVFDNSYLEVMVRIEVVDEFGRIPEEDYEYRTGFSLRCSYTCYDYEAPTMLNYIY